MYKKVASTRGLSGGGINKEGPVNDKWRCRGEVPSPLSAPPLPEPQAEPQRAGIRCIEELWGLTESFGGGIWWRSVGDTE